MPNRHEPKLVIQLAVGVLIGLLGENAISVADDRSTVLALVSLDYWLDGQEHPRNRDLEPYMPLVKSRDAGVREVAMMSAAREIVIWQFSKKEKNPVKDFGESIERFLGVGPDGRPNLNALKNLLNDDAMAENISDIINTQHAMYTIQSKLAEMRDELWDRADALARQGVQTSGFDAADLDVSVALEKRRGWVVTMRNRSSKDLQHLTLDAVVKKKPLPPATPGLDGVLGGLASGQESLEKMAEAGATFADSVAAYRELQKRPFRSFVYIPTLPAGKDCKAVLLHLSTEFSQSESAAFSVWGDGLVLEDKPLPQFDVLVEESRKKMEQYAKQKAAKQKADKSSGRPPATDLLAKGSIWRGTSRVTSTSPPGPELKTEIRIQVRNGDHFVGRMSKDGGNSTTIEGTAANGVINWNVVIRGKSGLPHTGTIKNKRIQVTFSGPGSDEPVEGTMTLNYVPTDKKSPAGRQKMKGKK